jgi:hypothetical protein
MNQPEAAQIALKYIESIREDPKLEVQILEEHTIKKPYGWIFFYQSKKYLHSDSITDVLVGNGPVLVLETGTIVQFPTAIPIDEAIRRYEAGLPLLPRRTTSAT